MSNRDQLHAEYFGSDHVTVIEAARGWRPLALRELWAYRELLWVLANRDIKVRYKQTALGVAWAVLQPVSTMVLFSIIFGAFAKLPSGGHPYPIFVYAALLPWTFFSSSVGTAASSMAGSMHIINKVYFPRLLVPMSSIGATLVDFGISMGILLVLMLYYHVAWTPQLLAVPALVTILILNALGFGTFFAALNVAYRDFRHVLPLLLQLWMYATPVIYASSLLPDGWKWVLYANPIAGVTEGFRAAFLDLPFDFRLLACSFASALAALFIGVAYFEKIERHFTDML